MHARYLSLQTQTQNILRILLFQDKMLKQKCIKFTCIVHCQSCVCSISMEIIRLFPACALFTCYIYICRTQGQDKRDTIRSADRSTAGYTARFEFSQTWFWKVWSVGIYDIFMGEWFQIFRRQVMRSKSHWSKPTTNRSTMLSCHLYPSSIWHFPGQSNPKNEGTRFLRNTRNHSSIFKASDPRRP